MESPPDSQTSPLRSGDTRLRSVHLDRKLSATARTPTKSTIVESPTGKVAQTGDTVIQQPQLLQWQDQGLPLRLTNSPEPFLDALASGPPLSREDSKFATIEDAGPNFPLAYDNHPVELSIQSIDDEITLGDIPQLVQAIKEEAKGEAGQTRTRFSRFSRLIGKRV